MTSSPTVSAVDAPFVDASFANIPAHDVPASEAELLLRERFERWMGALPERPTLHARFANTLSLLEHIGSIKIARTQAGSGITEEILRHLAEETRHAAYLKRLARRIDPRIPEDYGNDGLIAGARARGYFARLDVTVRDFTRRQVAPELRNAAAYRLVTWLVERRAMWLYPAWQLTLERAEPRRSVRSIIGEETRHLEEITAGIDELGLTGLDGLVAREEALFAPLAEEIMMEMDERDRSLAS